MKTFFSFVIKALLVLCLILIAGLFFIKWRMDHEGVAITPLAMSTKDVDLTPSIDPNFTPQTLPPTGEPQHPFMAVTDTSAMHAGSWENDVHPAKAVSSDKVDIITRGAGGKAARQCATFTFIKAGHPLILCGGFTSFRLQLLHKDTLEMLAMYDLPMRPSTFEAMVKRDTDIIFTDTSGGAYLYLDNEDRAVLADAKQRIRRIKAEQLESGKWQFRETDSWDMTDYVPNDCYHWNNLRPKGECDGITTVMPDYNGLLWWVTRNGRVGSLDPETGKVLATDLNGEEIQNSFALDEDGAYIVSDHAMYHMKLVDGMPTQQWRVPYDRGSGRKVGSINQGSGTSPSLFGENYLTFTDNADDHMNIYVARRGALVEGESRVICKVPVFTKGKSVTDNSMIAYDRSIILENNSGYTNSMIQKDYNDVEGGVVRVDVREDESGCDKIWTNPLKVPSVVPKLSLGNGIAYFYSFDLLENGDRLWSLVGLDFETGKEVVRIPTGTGEAFNNNWASIAIDPEGGTWVGTRQGVLKIKDSNYFPSSFDQFKSSWYSSFLRTMDEPSFQKHGEQNLVRFTWLPTFHNPIAVRVEISEDQAGKIILKRTDGAGGYEAGKVVEVLEKNLTSEELFQIKRTLADLNNCSPTKLDLGLDGSQWIYETFEEGQHCISDIWSPGTEGRKGQFREFGINLFKMAGLDTSRIKFY